MIVARFGMNSRTRLVVPRTERSSLIIVDGSLSIMVLIRSSPIPTVRRQYVTKIVKLLHLEWILDGFIANAAA